MGSPESPRLDRLGDAAVQIPPPILRPAWSGRLRRGKLRVPDWPAGAVLRPRVMARIAEGAPLLTLIVAPAGFGKTLAAVEWARQEPAAAWLTADAADTSLPRFWAHLHQALAAVSPDGGELVAAAFEAHSRAPAIDLGRMFADELLDAPTPVRLVIDDLHLVPESEVYEFLAGLLETPPPALRLLIASRIEPPIALTRLRLRGVLCDLRGDDLLFTAAETGRLIDRVIAGNDRATVEWASALWQQTRGWPVGVRLGAHALARYDVAPETVLTETREAGAHLIMVLLEEILAGRPPRERQALVRAALPDAFTAGLVEALVDAAERDPGEAVAAAVRFALAADLCRQTAGRDGNWLAFHPIFRDALRRRLDQEETLEAVRDLHRRAAQWCEEAGRAEAAIFHWVAAGRVEAAITLIEREAPAAFGREDWPSVASWLALLPGDVVDCRAELLLAGAWVAQLRGQAVLLRDYLHRLEALLERGGVPEERREEVHAEMALLSQVLLLPLQIDPERAMNIARRATAQIPSSRLYHHGIAWGVLGAALQAAGHSAEAVEILTAWSEKGHAHGDVGSVRGLLGLLFIHAQAGELSRVESVGRFMQELGERHHLRLTLGWAHRFLGDARYELNDLDGAIAHYGAVARDEEYVHLVGLREAFFGLARASLAGGNRGEAWRAIRRCREVMVAYGAVGHLPALDACEAYLALRIGDLDLALAWANANQPTVDDATLHVHSHPAVLRAAILATGGQAERREALSLLIDLRARAARVHFVGLCVHIDALIAVVQMRSGESDAALDAMRHSLQTGMRQGFTRSYLDLLPAFAPELGALAAHLALPTAVHHALAAGGLAAAMNPVPPLAFLTRREREVLAALIRRLSYQEIAAQLFISPFTVKRHAASIYGKLGVSSRLEAIHAVQEQGWQQ
jgi:LuxR family maltose regulon positive regulatory protein